MENGIEFSKIVGIPVRMGATKHAMIRVKGYLSNNGSFVSLDWKAAKRYFAPSGEVFAPNFFEFCSDLVDYAVSFPIKLTSKAVLNDSDSKYIVSFLKDVRMFGKRADIFPIGSISSDAEKNNEFAESHKFTDGTHYAVCGDYLYRFTNRQHIERWNLRSEEFIKDNSNTIFQFHYGYILLCDPVGNPHFVDKMSNMTLMYWFLDHTLTNKYPDLKPLVNAIPRDELLKSVKILDAGKSLEYERIKRALDLLDTVKMTKEQIDSLSESPSFANLIRSTIDEYKQDYLKDIENKYSKQLEELNDQYAQKEKEADAKYNVSLQQKKTEFEEVSTKLSVEKAKLSKEIEKLSLQREQLQSEVDELTLNSEIESEKIQQLSENKDKLINDFQIVKEVMSLLGGNTVKSNETVSKEETDNTLEIVNITDNELTNFEDFGDNLTEAFHGFGVAASSSRIMQLLVSYGIVLVPDIRIAYAITKATGKCYVKTAYVGVDWQSFKSLWESGLELLIQSCSEHPEVMHYLILQNVNLSYMPSYIQPLLDASEEFTLYFPGTTLIFPDNLRVICVPVKDKAIPMSENCLKRIGCYPKGKVKDIEKSGKMDIQGFLSPDVLNNEIPEEEKNDYQSYKEEDDD